MQALNRVCKYTFSSFLKFHGQVSHFITFIKKNEMSEIQSIIEALITFRDQRNWKQFHNTKDLALALSIEAAELNELFLWKEENEAEKTNRENIQDELADILAYAFLLAEKHDFNIKQIILEKIKKNEKKYPVEKSRNSARKYNEL